MIKRPYMLWDTDTENRIGAYETEAAALAVVRNAAQRNGPDRVRTFSLYVADANDEFEYVAHGAALLRRAQQAAANSSYAASV
ncbi:MAG: hypothetical protein HY329_06495 [Chloroflexi bacterium]|nr:hypothetical protein [Chloroflexota bacterium]